MPPISFDPVFQHQDWVDNLDRVQAGGDNGFNRRFNDLRTDLETLQSVMKAIDQAIQSLQKPPAQAARTTLAPMLLGGVPPNVWIHENGIARKPPAPVADLNGMMAVDLPHNARITGFRVTGRNGTAGSVRVSLKEKLLTVTTADAVLLALMVGQGDPFTAPDATFIRPNALIDTVNKRYFVTVEVSGATGAGAVEIHSIQITHIVDQD
jgi:hypothetical protein